jgi:hypothetical protein
MDGLVSVVLFVIPQTATNATYEGELLTASQTELMVRVGADLETFAVSPATSVRLNGRPAQVNDLSMGDALVISAETRDGNLVAATVSAMTSK